jgi:hypothetical protein
VRGHDYNIGGVRLVWLLVTSNPFPRQYDRNDWKDEDLSIALARYPRRLVERCGAIFVKIDGAQDFPGRRSHPV